MVEEGIIPGRRPLSLVGSDAVVHDPRGRWSSVVIRLLGMGLILDGTKDYAPVAALHTPQGAPDQYPVVKLDDNTWTVTMDRVASPAHSGFQRFSSGIFVIDARTDEPIGYLPSAGGHHDCVIVPRTNAELRNSRSTTL